MSGVRNSFQSIAINLIRCRFIATDLFVTILQYAILLLADTTTRFSARSNSFPDRHYHPHLEIAELGAGNSPFTMFTTSPLYTICAIP
jgi:hypothetical protein